MSAHEMSPYETTIRPGVPAAEALEGLPVASPHRLGGARLTATTATTLRAALDLLLGDSVPRRPLEVRWDEGALEIRCPVVQAEAITLAGGLMETIEGSLGAPSQGEREWVLRAPVHAPQPMYLMLQQGTLALAVPWHSVLRVRMAKREDVGEMARREGSAVLPPFVSVPGAEPRPAVLLGLGLKRAYLLADRLIWRMPAEPAESESDERPVTTGRAVRTMDGEIYWAVDPSELMSAVEPGPLPRGYTFSELEPGVSTSTPPPSVAAPPPPTIAAPPPPPPITLQTPRERWTPEAPPLRELQPSEVEPLGVAPKAPAPAAAPPPGTAPAEAPPPPRQPVQRAAMRALIAEDSIIGRIFLERLLARRGYEVTSLGTARELAAALTDGPWDIVLADVALPDATRAEHLRRHADGRWVALTRDREDERIAREAGVSLSLRKPFESDHLERLLPLLRWGSPS
jgi:CheY-like chemotaxis protein